MGDITNKLNYLKETKNLIKKAIVEKGQTVSDTDTFRSYAGKISQISGGVDGIPLNEDSGELYDDDVVLGGTDTVMQFTTDDGGVIEDPYWNLQALEHVHLRYYGRYQLPTTASKDRGFYVKTSFSQNDLNYTSTGTFVGDKSMNIGKYSTTKVDYWQGVGNSRTRNCANPIFEAGNIYEVEFCMDSSYTLKVNGQHIPNYNETSTFPTLPDLQTNNFIAVGSYTGTGDDISGANEYIQGNIYMVKVRDGSNIITYIPCKDMLTNSVVLVNTATNEKFLPHDASYVDAGPVLGSYTDYKNSLA